jgi:hypothetical protein
MGKHLILILKWALHYAIAIAAGYLLALCVLPHIVDELPSGGSLAIIVIMFATAMSSLASHFVRDVREIVREFRQGVADAEAEIALRQTGRKDSEH